MWFKIHLPSFVELDLCLQSPRCPWPHQTSYPQEAKLLNFVFSIHSFFFIFYCICTCPWAIYCLILPVVLLSLDIDILCNLFWLAFFLLNINTFRTITLYCVAFFIFTSVWCFFLHECNQICLFYFCWTSESFFMCVIMNTATMPIIFHVSWCACAIMSQG